MSNKSVTLSERPPIVVVMGHIDHGKSTLLDYIRKTNVVAGESGGITQHISAYEAVHKSSDGKSHRITFLDTPGHEAFSAMRARGATAADVAVLVVSAEDGVKAQTKEAFLAIKNSGTPYVVAINKIDKPNANPEKVKSELTENEIYLEGYGGDVPFAQISAKTGQGIPELLDLIILLAEMKELKGDTSLPAEGFVIESHRDPKRGVSATLVITNGTLHKGDFIVAGTALSPVRAITDSTSRTVEEAQFSSPILIAGFDELPEAGAMFSAYTDRKEAEAAVFAEREKKTKAEESIIGTKDAQVSIPIILKTDVAGTLDAVVHELSKIQSEKVNMRVVSSGVGDISENDVKCASGSERAIIIGFRVGIDSRAQAAAERSNIPTETFSIIYNITDYMEKEVINRTPKEEVEETLGEARILKTFSRTRDSQVIGGEMLSGSLRLRAHVKIVRRGTEIGRGTIEELQQQKVKTSEVKDGQFGTMIEAKMEIATGDVVVAYHIVTK